MTASVCCVDFHYNTDMHTHSLANVLCMYMQEVFKTLHDMLHECILIAEFLPAKSVIINMALLVLLLTAKLLCTGM